MTRGRITFLMSVDDLLRRYSSFPPRCVQVVVALSSRPMTVNEVASNIGVGVSSARIYVRACVDRGYVAVAGRASRRIIYVATEKALGFLS